MTGVRSRMHEGLTADRLRLETRRARGPFALLVLAAVVALAALALLAAKLEVPLPWQDPYEVRVVVDDAKGVTPGSNEVRISGVVVGRIVGVEARGGRAVLTARIDREDGPVFRDARARLRPKTPLEDMVLEIEHRGAPRAGRLGPDDVLDAERTRTPVHVADVLDVFDADVRPRVARAITALGEGLQDGGAELRSALRELVPFFAAAGRLSDEIARRDHQTRRLVGNLAALNTELARREGQVRGVVARGSRTFAGLASVERPLGRLLEELEPTLAELPRSFGAVRAATDDVDRALVALRPAARALPGGLRAVRELAPDLRTAADRLTPALPALRGLARSLPGTAADLRSAILSLRPQVPRLDRVTTAVLPCRLAIQKFFHWTLSVGKLYGVRGAVLRGDPVVQAASLAGAVRDPGLTSEPDCAAGGPRK